MRVAVIHNRDTSGVINVFGPQNRERYNPRTVERVARALEAGGHNVRIIDGNMHIVERLQDFMPRVIAGDRPGMVFNMAYGIQGVSRYTHLPAMLEMLGVPYVGSGPQAHGLALDKVIAKIMFEAAGLPTAKFWNFASVDDHFDDLAFPVIVKPKMEAVSFGIRIVDNEADLREAVATIINEFGQHVLVEQFIAGRELAIGLLGNGTPEVLPIVEIDLNGDPNAIQSAEDKLRAPRDKLCPAPLDPDQTAALEELARRAFRSLDLYDFARVDLRLDAEGNPYILEINSMASLGLTGTYVHAAQTAGYSYEALINRMLDVAAIRYFGEQVPDADAKPAATQSERPQTRIRTHIRSNAATIEENVRTLVDARTPTADANRVNQLGDWVSRQLEQLGFRIERRPRIGLGDVLICRNHYEDRDDALLLAHLDTGAPAEEWSPFRADERRLYGTGAAESKGGIAIALAALRALRHARALRRLRLTFLLTTDSAETGAGARAIIQETSARARFVISLKAGEPPDAVVTARAGETQYELESAFRRQRRAISPQRVLRHFCNRLLALQELDGDDIHAHLTRIRFDAGGGRLPWRAQAQLVLRFNDPQLEAQLHQRVQRLADARTTPGIRMHVTDGSRRPPLQPTAADQELFELVSSVARNLSRPLESAHRWAAADISFADPSAGRIDGMGPVGGNARTAEEYIVRYSLVERATVLALTLLECRQPRRRGRSGSAELQVSGG